MNEEKQEPILIFTKIRIDPESDFNSKVSVTSPFVPDVIMVRIVANSKVFKTIAELTMKLIDMWDGKPQVQVTMSEIMNKVNKEYIEEKEKLEDKEEVKVDGLNHMPLAFGEDEDLKIPQKKADNSNFTGAFSKPKESPGETPLSDDDNSGF